MNQTHISFENLPFHTLFQDYISNFNNLHSFYEINPHSSTEIESALNSFEFKSKREHTVQLLKDYNKQFGAGQKTLKSIERFTSKNAVAVVTGQQLTLFGGPLFTIYKILTAIHFARKWEQEYQIPCVPVFWMADEDHDYHEIAGVGFSQNDEHLSFHLERTSQIEPRVSEIALDQNFETFKKNVIESQFDTDFTEPLWRKIDKCYKKGATVGNAFGKLILSLFEDYGLILAGTAHSAIKQEVSNLFIHAVKNVEHQFELLKDQTEKLTSLGYHDQVHLQYSNIFWIDEKRNRLKLSYENERWSTDGEQHVWSSDELINEISSHPERFSPNVFLRPIFQNELLPGFAYIAGPGEISYYAQMKQFYGDFGQIMPVIMPRFSATLMEAGIDRIFEKLPFDFTDYNKRIEDLESEFIEESDSPDIERIFNTWKVKIEENSEDKIEAIKEIDPTLEGSSEKAIAIFFSELDKLKGKVYRSVKEQEKTQLKRIRKIKTHLYPNSNLQEREVAFIYFMNKYGLEIWDDLLENLKNEQPTTHKLIRL